MVHALKAYIALCGMFRNEHTMVREWVSYHSWLGVDKFYLFDHGSQPPLNVNIQDMLSSNTVEYHYFKMNAPEDSPTGTLKGFSPQSWVYQRCLDWFGRRHKFIGFVDADEFIVLNDPQQQARPNITAFLEPFEQHGGVKLKWKLFGSSNLTSTPKSALESYVHYIPEENMNQMPRYQANPLGFTKSIVNTARTRGPCDPHQCGLRAGEQYVTPDGQAVPPSCNATCIAQLTWGRADLYHYHLQSREEFAKKLARGSGHTQYVDSNAPKKSWADFNSVNELCTAVSDRGPKLHAQCCAGQ